MDRPFDLLYSNSIKNFDELLRLLDEDELHAYYECGDCLARQEETLLPLLPRETLKKYTDVREEQENYINRALFRRGLALGLRLSALSLL